ncbi:hemolysin family protein [Allobaculum sp. JKK-2023]|uniref:hemolysin family protein n=1 Tax=Allobaculum sp. JKK-2023 TaxID=3108943 RepID=UPI002B05BAB6|nr:transporter associated domain-containing protein [Allobaculum sp. JKK-2023]
MNLVIASIAVYLVGMVSLAVWSSLHATLKELQMDLYIGLFGQWLGSILLAFGLAKLVELPLSLLSVIGIIFAASLLVGWLVLHFFKYHPLPKRFCDGFEACFRFLFTWWLVEPPANEQDEIDLLLDPAAKQDYEDQREVLENALDLGETTLDEICTHRSEMVCLSMKDDPAKWKQVIQANRHTFYPITNESGDDIIGVLDTRDYFRLHGFGQKNIMEHCVDKPLFAAENTTADELLHIMKNRRTYIAIVLDEYGGVVGLVTLHDIIEELFGELSEEEEKRQAEIVKLPKGVWRIAGEANLKDVAKALGIPLELDDFETFSGYVLGSIGYIPEDGSQLEVKIGPLIVQIKRIAGHRIRQALVKMEPAASAPSAAPVKKA